MKSSHAEGTSTVTCLCGKASLTFAANSGVSSECGCFSCREKLQWATAQAGREWNLVIFPGYYVVDDVVHVTGDEHLRLTKLRQVSSSDFVLATCCHSVLAVIAPYYRGTLSLFGRMLVRSEATHQVQSLGSRPGMSRGRCQPTMVTVSN